MAPGTASQGGLAWALTTRGEVGTKLSLDCLSRGPASYRHLFLFLTIYKHLKRWLKLHEDRAVSPSHWDSLRTANPELL